MGYKGITASQATEMTVVARQCDLIKSIAPYLEIIFLKIESASTAGLGELIICFNFRVLPYPSKNQIMAIYEELMKLGYYCYKIDQNSLVIKW